MASIEKEIKIAVDYLNSLLQVRAWREFKERSTEDVDQEIAELRAEIAEMRAEAKNNK